MSCIHEDTIASRAAVSRTATSAAMLAARVDIDAAKAACQRECGATSPWHGVETEQLTEAAAVARLDARHRGVLHQELLDVVGGMRAWARRRRSSRPA